MSQITILKQYFNSCTNKKMFSWLNGRSYSEAFVICVGAGPWRFNRRKTIQGQALEKLNGKDLSQIEKQNNFYPLNWQNNILNNSINYLNSNNLNFNKMCEKALAIYKKDNSYGAVLRGQILDMSGCKTMPKVLSLFCRDALKINAFPIDRHVKKKLQELGLPTKEEEMIKLCYKAELKNVSRVATAFVRNSSDMDNPDWSVQ